MTCPNPRPPGAPPTDAPAGPMGGALIVICVGCTGERADPAGGPCARCHGTGRDPNP